MATIESCVPRSRRALLAAAAGGLAAFAAGALGRPLPARAEGEVIKVGDEYTAATSLTSITNQANDDMVFRAVSTHAGLAIRGASAGHDGVEGRSSGTGRSGVFGHNTNAAGYGVYGHNEGSGNTGYLGGPAGGVWGASTVGDGVQGHSSATGKSGVYGHNTAAGYGVHGANEGSGNTGSLGGPAHGVYGGSSVAGGCGVLGSSSNLGGYAVWGRNTGNGNAGYLGGPAHGVYGGSRVAGGYGGYFLATKASGFALATDGRLRFVKRSGTATIAAGTKSRQVTPSLGLQTTSKVLCTLQGNPGGTITIQRVAINTTTGRFTVYLTANATQNVKFAWLILD